MIKNIPAFTGSPEKRDISYFSFLIPVQREAVTMTGTSRRYTGSNRSEKYSWSAPNVRIRRNPRML